MRFYMRARPRWACEGARCVRLCKLCIKAQFFFRLGLIFAKKLCKIHMIFDGLHKILEGIFGDLHSFWGFLSQGRMFRKSGKIENI